MRYVRAFLAAVDEGSFTAAGQLLGLSQASISRSVAAMERAVGAPLLDRTTRRMALTSTGQAVLPHARRLQLEADAILRVRDRRRDEVRVGYAWAALGAHTTEAVARFGQRLHRGADPDAKPGIVRRVFRPLRIVLFWRWHWRFWHRGG